MKIFTQAFKHLTHNLPQATAFLASRHCIFSSSVIPEFLSEDSRDSRYLLLYNRENYMNILRIFILSDSMQFSSTMMIPNSNDSTFTEEILLPLLRSKKYFSSTLRKCIFELRNFKENASVKKALSLLAEEVKTLTDLELRDVRLQGIPLHAALFLQTLKKFSSLETLTLFGAGEGSKIANREIEEDLATPSFSKTLRKLVLKNIEIDVAFFVAKCNLHNLRSLECRGLPRDDNTTLIDFKLLSSSSVCKTLHHLEISSGSFSSPESISAFTELRSLRFTDSSNPSDAYSLQFLQSLQHNLIELYLEGCSKIASPQEYQHLAHLHDLRVLHVVNDRENFRGDVIKSISGLTELREINFGTTGFIKTDLVHLHNMSNLRSLNLSRCHVGCTFNNSGEDEDSPSLFDQMCSAPNFSSSLEFLDLSSDLSYGGLSDKDLKSLHRFKDSLTELNLSRIRQITNQGISYLKDLNKLKTLNLADLQHITDFRCLGKLQSLEVLCLVGCYGLDDESFKNAFASGNVDDGDDDRSSFPKLAELYLSHCYDITDDAFKYLVENENVKNNLHTLSLEENRGLTMDAFSVYIIQLKALQKLMLYNVNEEDVDDCEAAKIVRNHRLEMSK